GNEPRLSQEDPRRRKGPGRGTVRGRYAKPETPQPAARACETERSPVPEVPQLSAPPARHVLLYLEGHSDAARDPLMPFELTLDGLAGGALVVPPRLPLLDARLVLVVLVRALRSRIPDLSVAVIDRLARRLLGDGPPGLQAVRGLRNGPLHIVLRTAGGEGAHVFAITVADLLLADPQLVVGAEIGRASCREREEVRVVRAPFKKK